jgi:DNA-binding transcriptional ArsR family regulator
MKKLEERLKEFEQLGATLDKHCSVLLAEFDFDRARYPERTYGFNELYRKLDKDREIVKMRFDRRSLSLHLKHLREKGLVEVREDDQSNLKIKPRRYMLSKHWNDLAEVISPIPMLNVAERMKDYRKYETETLTVLLMGLSEQLCIEMFERALCYPEFMASIHRDYYYDYIEQMIEAYRSTVSDRHEQKKASRALKKFDDFYRQKIKEKYNSPESNLEGE